MSNLEKIIHDILAASITGAAKEIAQAVRGALASEIMGAPASAAATPAAVPKRRGRPPGTKNQPKAATPAAPVPTAKANASKGKTTKAKGRPKTRTYTDADLARALEVIKAKPGLRPSQYRDAAKMEERVWDNAIFKLKQDGKIKVVGKARGTSYTVA